MTTSTSPDAATDAAADVLPVRRPRRVARLAAVLVVGLAAVVAISGAGLAAWDAGYDARILPGVHVGSVDVSGLDRATAAQVLASAYGFGQGRLILRAPDGDIAIPYSDFARRPDVGAMVDEAMHAGRDATVAERALGEVGQALRGTTLEPRLSFDEAALTASITTALRALERPPVDAMIANRLDGLVTWRARSGQVIDAGPVVAAAVDAAARVDAPAEIVIPVEATAVPPGTGDTAVAIAKVLAQRLIRDVAVTYGGKTWTIKAATVRKWVGFEKAADGSVRPTVDSTGISKVLGGVAKAILRKPVSASFLLGTSGKPVGTVAGRNGRQLDVDATVAGIVTELLQRGGGGLPRPVAAVAEVVAPALTTAQARQSAPLMARLGTWTTWFPISDRNYFGANIWRPALIINGTVLAPGQTFEWWRAVGPITAARGFGPGGVIRGDHTEPTGALGGGMCSSSTTLFNAALRAGLQMGARSNHTYYINRYPLGLDATVSIMGGGRQTMSFTNDTGHAILIRGIRIGGTYGRGYVRYEIWGTPDGRTVSLSAPAVSNVLHAVTNTFTVTTLRHGVRNQTEYPSNGMDVSVTRVVRDASGHVIHSETYRSHYALWNGRIEVGL